VVERAGDGERDPAAPPAIGDLLDRVLAGFGAPPTRAMTTVFDAWPDVVGDVVAAHARPVSVDRGALVVAVDEPAWATELRYRRHELLDRLDAVLGPAVITSIEVRVRPPASPSR
jgi:predicted nucleic acid-binding Zn ribbon protein